MGREAGFVFKSEDLCFVSRELCCSCLGFCVLFKQLWGLKPLSARGMVPLKAAPCRGRPAAGSKAACRAAVSSPWLPSSSPASPVEFVPNLAPATPLLELAMPLTLSPYHYTRRIYGCTQAAAVLQVDSMSCSFLQETQAISCLGLSLSMPSVSRETISYLNVLRNNFSPEMFLFMFVFFDLAGPDNVHI